MRVDKDVTKIIEKRSALKEEHLATEFLIKEELDYLKSNNIDGLIAIGGDGTFTGGLIFGKEYNFPVIGVPATIDNDIFGTSHTIGFDSA